MENIVDHLISFQQQFRILHWQTKSYAEHKALGKSYEALDGLFDKFIELVYGREGIPALTNNAGSVYRATFEPYNEGMLKRYATLMKEVMEHLYDVAGAANDLKNISDEIEGEFHHLLYRLQQK
jgi:hypothetical protein